VFGPIRKYWVYTKVLRLDTLVFCTSSWGIKTGWQAMLHMQRLLMPSHVQWTWQITEKEFKLNQGNKSIEAKMRPSKWSKVGAQISDRNQWIQGDQWVDRLKVASKVERLPCSSSIVIMAGGAINSENKQLQLLLLSLGCFKGNLLLFHRYQKCGHHWKSYPLCGLVLASHWATLEVLGLLDHHIGVLDDLLLQYFSGSILLGTNPPQVSPTTSSRA
jgi:hypothetical protein